MARPLRYTTFAPGELAARLRELSQNRAPEQRVASPGSRGASLEAHCMVVRYPDGYGGDCRSERIGPSYSRFHYEYDKQPLACQVWTQFLGSDPDSIETKAQELAALAYQEALVRERKDYFQRASLPRDGSRNPDPALFCLTAKEAKERAGKYALCRRTTALPFRISRVFDTLDEANAEWQVRGDRRTVVACCSRLDRCWQLPRFNALYAVFDPRPNQGARSKESEEQDRREEDNEQ